LKLVKKHVKEISFKFSQNKTDLEKLYETNDLIGEDYIDPRSVDAFKKKKPPTPVQIQPQQENEDFEDDDDDYVAPTAASVSRDQNSKSKSTDYEKKHLIENQTEFYKSIDSPNRLKTTLMVNRPNSGVQFDDEKGSYVESDSDMEYSMIDEEEDQRVEEEKKENEPANDESRSVSGHDDSKSESSATAKKLVKSVKEMANILVKSAINLALADVQTMSLGAHDAKKSGKDIEKMYRYCFSAKSRSEQENSRLDYYKDYDTKLEKFNQKGEKSSNNQEEEDENEDNKFAIEFEDEPYE
jgi:hypothetical protein